MLHCPAQSTHLEVDVICFGIDSAILHLFYVLFKKEERDTHRHMGRSEREGEV